MKKVTNDHRIRVTKLLIRKAFTSLLNQKPIQSISVKELCELAGINRGTFYSHYTDIYDLCDQIEADMLRDLKDSMEPMLRKDTTVTPVKITTEIFRCLKENSDLCTVTLGKYGDKEFMMKLMNLGREQCLESYSHYFKKASPRKIEYFYAFVSSGCIGLLRKWLADGMVSPIEEIAKMAEKIMLSGVEFLQEDEAS
ncbi:TetR/AcrR family transcriptional regulator [Clostridium facile]|uniref:TetR/AcrR family transcriptional regulator n=1 Tax=Clostridium facile TaxID=2763035 RepID=A0ABR7IT80_9CLOT|nr:TetR/AcrR family transcriptional regulator [Clostridium facile]MBC5788359.1 TetR/AcrR family transcriptional regulator [Clostridium facile]